jgi:hypothetical protein
MDELKEKLAELKDAIAAANSQREMVRSAFSQLSGLLGEGTAGASRLGGGAPGPAPATSFSGGPRGPASGAPVQDLGVVGRGSKRLQLQPVGAVTTVTKPDQAPSSQGRSSSILVSLYPPSNHLSSLLLLFRLRCGCMCVCKGWGGGVEVVLGGWLGEEIVREGMRHT